MPATLKIITSDLISDYVQGRLNDSEVELMQRAMEDDERVFDAVIAAGRATVKIRQIFSANQSNQ